jgi:hypothetical protein
VDREQWQRLEDQERPRPRPTGRSRVKSTS